MTSTSTSTSPTSPTSPTTVPVRFVLKHAAQSHVCDGPGDRCRRHAKRRWATIAAGDHYYRSVVDPATYGEGCPRSICLDCADLLAEQGRVR